VWCLAVRVVLPGDTYKNSSIRGAWRLKARVPRQAVWKWQRLAVCVPRQATLLLQPSVVDSVGVIYKAFGDTSKVGLLVGFELWLGTYPLSCGSG